MTSVDKLRCPSCGSADTRPAHPGGAIDLFMQMFRRRPFRCRSCRKRFYSIDLREDDSAESDEPIDQHAG